MTRRKHYGRGLLRLAALVVFAVLAGLALGYCLVHGVFPLILYVLQWWPWPPGR